MVALENFGWVLVMIGVMIMIHELGHYWAARYFDVKIETFSFGFGPRLFGFRRGETDFRFSAILFGGYVKMAGEQPGEESTDPRSFLAKPRWQRLIIAFAGPWMNILLAVAILTGLYMHQFPKLPEASVPGVVGLVLPDSAAAKAGIQEGDRIVAIDGKRNPTWEDITLKEISSASLPIQVSVIRSGSEITLTVTPELDDRNGIGKAGWAEQADIQVGGVMAGLDAEKKGLRRGDILVSVNGHPIRSTYRLRELIKASEGRPVELVYSREGAENSIEVTPRLHEVEGQKSWMIGVNLEPRITFVQLGFGDAIVESVRANVRGATLIFQLLKGIVEQRMSAKTLEGPIRIAQLSGDAAREGLPTFLALMAMISLNLAIFNLLPIPVLDGGTIVVLLLEMTIGRDLSLRFKERVIQLGFVFLMMVVVFVIYNDISKIMPPG
ncbi:MAG: RIP metalloprotease RseP [Acidimicrobiia bacterium]|nr:RIP metalloprotease RseP [Acidimicrobiia bacterium]